MGQPLKCLFQNDLQKCPVENATIGVEAISLFGVPGVTAGKFTIGHYGLRSNSE